MTKQEYQHIRNLAWKLLSDAKISKLPVDIAAIAIMYDLSHLLDYSKTRYANALLISANILRIYGYTSNEEFSKCLAIRILSPMIILKALDIQSPYDIRRLCEIPNQIATQRFERYQMLLGRNKFGQSGMESPVLRNFKPWINQTKNQC